MDITATSPSVVYEVVTTRGERLFIDNPAQLPDPSLIEEIREPIVKAYILCPNESIGDILQLIQEKRGTMDHTESLDTRRVMLHCELPLNEILVDFNDKIKSITRGYGSMDYEHSGNRAAKLVHCHIGIGPDFFHACYQLECLKHSSLAWTHLLPKRLQVNDGTLVSRSVLHRTVEARPAREWRTDRCVLHDRASRSR